MIHKPQPPALQIDYLALPNGIELYNNLCNLEHLLSRLKLAVDSENFEDASSYMIEIEDIMGRIGLPLY